MNKNALWRPKMSAILSHKPTVTLTICTCVRGADNVGGQTASFHYYTLGIIMMMMIIIIYYGIMMT